MSVTKKSLEEKLRKKAQYHLRWANHNFRILESIRWVAIIFSASTALGAALFAGYPWSKYVLSILAAVPAAILIVDHGMPLKKRYEWHALFRIEVERLIERLKNGAEPSKISEAMLDLDEGKYLTFPYSGEPGQPNAPRGRGGPDKTLVD